LIEPRIEKEMSLSAFPSTQFDVAVVNPGIDSYVRNQHTDTVDLADRIAAIYTENRKFNTYVASYGEAFRPHQTHQVLEATGAYRQRHPQEDRSPQTSTSAQTTIYLMKALRFLREVSVIMATSSTQMIANAPRWPRGSGSPATRGSR
jgi:hypothetical protein